MPDLTFFSDPHVDRVLGVVLELAAEVYVLSDRLRTLEQALDRSGTLSRSDLDAYVPSPEDLLVRRTARDALIARILAPMTAESDSPAPPFESA